MKDQLEKNGYVVIKNFLQKDFCKFAQVYFKIRQDTLDYDTDPHYPKSKNFYADPLIETILLTSCKKLSEIIEVNLIPQYSYARIYGPNEQLHICIDETKYDFSAVLCLGKPSLETNNIINISKHNNETVESELILEEGDLCFYKNSEIHCWKSFVEQSWLLHAYTHYTDKNGLHKNKLFDGRRNLGLKI